MGPIYDDPRLAALTLMRIAAEESQGPNELTGRMHAVLDDLAQRNGAGYLAELAIALARTGFIALDELATGHRQQHHRAAGRGGNRRARRPR